MRKSVAAGSGCGLDRTPALPVTTTSLRLQLGHYINEPYLYRIIYTACKFSESANDYIIIIIIIIIINIINRK